MKEIHALRKENKSIRSIAETLGISRNTVRKYLRNPGLQEPKPRLLRPGPATVRFETGPGEQGQVDLTPVTLVRPDGTTQQVWAFAMVLDWSRAGYVEFVAKAHLPGPAT